MDYCLLKDNVVVGVVATIDPDFTPPEGFALGPAGGRVDQVWTGDRYVSGNRYVLRHQAFTADECERIIDMGLKLAREQAKVLRFGEAAHGHLHHAVNEYRPDQRRSHIGWFAREHPAYAWLLDRIWAVVRTENASLFQLPLETIGRLQFTEYDASMRGHFAWHTDALVTQDGLERKLSFVLQLSDPATYEGGTFEIQDDGVLPLARGSALIFPSPMLHRVAPVTSGIRHSLVAWVKGTA